MKYINSMREVGHITAEVVSMIGKHIKPGISTGQINKICHDYITKKHNSTPACLGYQGFPKSICTSVNDVVCHGIPSN